MSSDHGNSGSLQTFRHGVHPKTFKEMSSASPIERMPFVDEYILPLNQHLGAPSKPIVKEGQKVRRGERIADAGGFVSVALHAPVDGIVVAIDLFDNPSGQMQPSIKIKTDAFSTQRLQAVPSIDVEQLDYQAFIDGVQQAGIVGMGGAAFPAHVKFAIPEGKSCRYLMLNGCECEPFLTCDHRIMVEYSDALIDGIRILQHFVQAEKIYIGIEANKPDAIAILREASAASTLPLEVAPLRVKYPQGG